MSQNINSEVTGKVTGIFSLKCFKGGTQAKIEHLENVTLNGSEFVPDTKIKEFSVTDSAVCEIYRCNITDTFLMSTKKLPVLYINVIHQKPVQKFLLYKVYLYFTITSEIKSVKDLLDEKVTGKYTTEISIDDMKKELNDPIEKYPGDEKMYEKLENFTKADSMVSLTNNLVDEVNSRLKAQYGKELDHFMNKPETFIKSNKKS